MEQKLDQDHWLLQKLPGTKRKRTDKHSSNLTNTGTGTVDSKAPTANLKKRKKPKQI